MHTYTTLSGLVMQQTDGTQELYFLYDDSNQPYALVYKSSATETPSFYYYLLNVQGDVVALMNTSGTIVARYSYDPWGVPTVMNSSSTVMEQSTFIGNINPLRYRGYYYDTETGFYYLQSRYYDPVIGRFISADTFATTDCNGFLSSNMFAYCENNPVNRSDPDGHWGIDTVVGAAIGGVVSAASYILSNSGNISASGLILAAGAGALSGAFLSEKTAVRAVGAVVSGIYTAFTTEGTLGEKILCGAASTVTSFVGGTASRWLGKEFSTVLENVVGGTIVNTTIGAAVDVTNRITQSLVTNYSSSRASNRSRRRTPQRRTRYRRTTYRKSYRRRYA